ncbi:hypothetical protein A5674_18375 [Mycobacterium malmoense]|nr:hypothetical protein A5674_18375 [Mycobacterium malmoense]
MQRADVAAGADIASGWIDYDDGSAGQQHTQQGGYVGGPVAQHDSDPRRAAAVLRDKRTDVARVSAEFAPGKPLPVILDRRDVDIEVQDVGDSTA